MSTIRSFGEKVVDRFVDVNAHKVDTNQTAVFSNFATNRWLGLRLEFMGTFVVTIAALFATLERNDISPGLVRAFFFFKKKRGNESNLQNSILFVLCIEIGWFVDHIRVAIDWQSQLACSNVESM